MGSPLSPATELSLNRGTPTSAKRPRIEEDAMDDGNLVAYKRGSSASSGANEGSTSSSPFISCVNDSMALPATTNNTADAASDRNNVDVHEQENASPVRAKQARVLSGNRLSPLKILSSAHRSSPSNDENMPPQGQSPRKLSSPEKRFPIKPNSPCKTTSEAVHVTHDLESPKALEEAMLKSPGLARAVAIFDEEQSMLDSVGDVSSAVLNDDTPAMEVDDAAGPDDTMVSTFSTFSAVPSMTMFARLGQSSPSKVSTLGEATPRAKPRGSPLRESPGNTTNLLDFTESMRYPSKKAWQSSTLSPRKGPALGVSPTRGYTNLIDFDLPPMPTPRSIPTISAREVESLKSGFLSEISSLKASLSGKEAEVKSLKTAVGDAEQRVGESMEQLREVRAEKEQLSAERDSWDARGREMENVLRKAKEEIELGQREREELESRFEESEKRREAAEMMHQEAESKVAGLRAGKEADLASSKASAGRSSPDDGSGSGSGSSSNTKEIEIAVERVARELHALYKNKHKTKVATLKKSYEARWEKKIQELESKLTSLSEENEQLRNNKDAAKATSSSHSSPGKTGAGNAAELQERKAQAVKDSASIKELNADVQRLEAVVETVQRDNEDLRHMLEKERVEKGDLVQLAEELMSMQQSFVATETPRPQRTIGGDGASSSAPRRREDGSKQANTTAASATSAARYQAGPTPRQRPLSQPEMPASSARTPAPSRLSGLRAPGTGLRPPQDRARMSASSGTGGSTRSGIMSSIERMGSHRGRAVE